MTDKTLNDLHVMLARIEERQIIIVDDIKRSREWQEKHEEKDEERFAGLNKYAASIALVAGFLGAAASYIWNKITGI